MTRDAGQVCEFLWHWGVVACGYWICSGSPRHFYCHFCDPRPSSLYPARRLWLFSWDQFETGLRRAKQALANSPLEPHPNINSFRCRTDEFPNILTFSSSEFSQSDRTIASPNRRHKIAVTVATLRHGSYGFFAVPRRVDPRSIAFRRLGNFDFRARVGKNRERASSE